MAIQLDRAASMRSEPDSLLESSMSSNVSLGYSSATRTSSSSSIGSNVSRDSAQTGRKARRSGSQLTLPGCLSVLSDLLNTFTVQGSCDEPTVYDSKKPVELSIAEYVDRWLEQTMTDKTELIVAACLIDRFIDATEIPLTVYNRHRILLSALLVATKTVSDYTMNNAHYAQVGGVHMKELNRLECAFLTDIDWNVNLSSAEHKRYTGYFAKHQNQSIRKLLALIPTS
eukprot:TRINITY_DN8670_c0_g1_i2.p1 TRINITY_DN8670_c0_g1~~TRINITY_DN8670_c0_g1_i2.p1  ORF type:complete len:228 (+),score=63.37 TRINITY_DN8670_c0_g1_i2:273-956(+)